MEENRSSYRKGVPILESKAILIFLTVKHRLFELSDPVSPAVHDRANLHVLNQFKIQLNFSAPISAPPSCYNMQNRQILKNKRAASQNGFCKAAPVTRTMNYHFVSCIRMTE